MKSQTEELYRDTFCGFIEGAAEAVLSLRAMSGELAAAAELFASVLLGGGKVLTAGNGGSAAEAMHMAEELSGRYKQNRKALPGIALCADGTALTCIGNDFGFDKIFSRQVEAFGREGDLLVLFSTSGKSENLVNAAREAKARGMAVLALLGGDGGGVRELADVAIVVKAKGAHVQEAHQVILHLLLEHVEEFFDTNQHPENHEKN